jgi:hypothetical protein
MWRQCTINFGVVKKEQSNNYLALKNGHIHCSHNIWAEISGLLKLAGYNPYPFTRRPPTREIQISKISPPVHIKSIPVPAEKKQKQKKIENRNRKKKQKHKKNTRVPVLVVLMPVVPVYPRRARV